VSSSVAAVRWYAVTGLPPSSDAGSQDKEIIAGPRTHGTATTSEGLEGATAASVDAADDHALTALTPMAFETCTRYVYTVDASRPVMTTEGAVGVLLKQQREASQPRTEG
jgi:hypothetical protein